MTEALVPSLREYTARYGLDRAPGRRCCADDALVMHPGPMNRGVEIAAEVADLPQVGDHRAGRATASPCAWRCCSCCSARRARAWRRERVAELVIQGGTRRRRHRQRGAPTSLVDDGAIVAVGADLDAPARRTLDAVGLRRRARARRPPHPPARARPGGGRDDRDRRRAPRRSAATPRSSPCPTPSRRSTRAAVVREVLDLGAHGAVRRARRRAPSPSAGRGEQLAPMAEMAALGVRLFTDDGTGVQDPALMRRALEYAAGLGVDRSPSTARTTALAAGGHMHEGEWSSRLGIPGQPAEAEELMVMRDIALARLTGARVHFQHLSTAGSVDAGARGQGRRAAGHRRGDAAPLHAHRRRAAPATTRCSR